MIKTDHILDAKGLACPMPIVKTKKTMKDLEAGVVLEVQATDKGSKADIKAWADKVGHHYLGTVEEGEILKHYLRKASDSEVESEKNHPSIISNDDLEAKLSDDNITIVDVREPAEYVFSHLPNAISIPLGEMENRMSELSSDKQIYVICRTGTRSDLAAQQLAESGYDVINVVPGMSEWAGPTTSSL
ncbi:sulfurtransferase TusA family protein [Guptibacillus hwajinpoensis]|uniref:Rhodanese-related sulfurtransferase/TusA-related sulfurtransferase n=1 Tax=Guptibacillus hwajinpoensis TaxID=208199 RepID=A0ABU0K525_9BACL|nr:sulfurtransferase TusA family protein [Alkalihalobacillus hemicentroti]MDQ0484443.1 rhodanese-related sulfurtransferase/TusA-related sulfurtransferase [Alkalihalobacillus hemicentroti]